MTLNVPSFIVEAENFSFHYFNLLKLTLLSGYGEWYLSDQFIFQFS